VKDRARVRSSAARESQKKLQIEMFALSKESPTRTLSCWLKTHLQKRVELSGRDFHFHLIAEDAEVRHGVPFFFVVECLLYNYRKCLSCWMRQRQHHRMFWSWVEPIDVTSRTITWCRYRWYRLRSGFFWSTGERVVDVIAMLTTHNFMQKICEDGVRIV
jgi:hypothetical protein